MGNSGQIRRMMLSDESNVFRELQADLESVVSCTAAIGRGVEAFLTHLPRSPPHEHQTRFADCLPPYNRRVFPKNVRPS